MLAWPHVVLLCILFTTEGEVVLAAVLLVVVVSFCSFASCCTVYGIFSSQGEV